MILNLIISVCRVHPKNLNVPFTKLINNNLRGLGINFACTNMTRPKVLVTHAGIPEAGLKLLKNECDVDVWEQEIPIPRAQLLSRIKGIDALYCVLANKVDEEVLNAAGSNLKIVATMSVGVDHLDLKALKSRNIIVGYTPGILTDAVAELTMGLLLATARRLIEANRAIYKGEWKTWSPLWMTGPKISGSNIGIVGLGRIGLRIAEYLQSFGANKIVYTSRAEKPAATKIGAQKVSLDVLLKDSDFVIVTIALVPESREMFNKETFEKMKKSAIFINVSRGEVVHQPSLLEALKNGTIRAAGLDVMTPEPIPLDSELLKLDNCVIFPHLGSAATETREEMSVITAQNILAVLRNQPEEMPSALKI